MALSANKTRSLCETVTRYTRRMDVAASQTIYVGAMLFRNASGLLTTTTSTGAFPFMGIATSYLLTTTATTDRPMTVSYEFLEEFTLAGVTAADIGKLVYASDDGTITLTSTNNSLIGYIEDIVTGTRVLVHLRNAV